MEDNIVIREEMSGDMSSFLPENFRNLILNNIEEVPSIIVEQTDSLATFAKKQKEAIDAAEIAKQAADSAKAKEVNLFSGKKVAIEALQETCAAQSSALVNLSAAIQAAFKHQEKIKDITEFLLGIGFINTTLNRMVVRELELRLKNASEKELSDLARKELENVVRQLKAQQDMAQRIENQKVSLERNETNIATLNSELSSLNRKINQMFEKIQKTTTSALSDLNIKREADSTFLRKQLEQKEASIDQKMDEHNQKIQQTIHNLIQEHNVAIKEGRQQIEDGLCEIKDLYENALESLLEQSRQFEKEFALFKAESKQEAEKMSREMRQNGLEISSKQEEQYRIMKKRERIILFIVIFVLAISVLTSFFAFRTL